MGNTIVAVFLCLPGTEEIPEDYKKKEKDLENMGWIED